MPLIVGLGDLLGRFAGRLLNSSLGWATILLFGKVSGRKQAVLLGIALGAVVWVLLLIGVALPDVGTALLAFVPAPSFVSRDLIRLAMLVGAVALPLAIGIAAVYVTDESHRPTGAGLGIALLRGYPFTFLLALTIAFLAVIAVVRKVQGLTQRWDSAHLPVVVKPGGYDRVLAQLEDVLHQGGLDVRREPAPRVLSIPPRLLARVAGSGLGALVPDRLMLLKAPGLEALVYPSDISILGTTRRLAHARALIAAELTTAPAYLTTSAESERVEDQLAGLADDVDARSAPDVQRRLAGVDRELMRLTVPFDEWETVYRKRLQVERDALRRSASGPAEAGPEPSSPPQPGRLAWALALGTIVLTLLDLTVAALGRARAPSRAPGSRLRRG